MSVLRDAEAGQQFGPYEITLSAEDSAAYAAAVGGPESPDYGATLPPMAVVAAALSRLIDDLGLFTPEVLSAGGTIHAGQEAEFLRKIQAGETIVAHARLSASSVRRDNRFATVVNEYRDSDGQIVGNSSSTIIVPA